MFLFSIFYVLSSSFSIPLVNQLTIGVISYCDLEERVGASTLGGGGEHLTSMIYVSLSLSRARALVCVCRVCVE